MLWIALKAIGRALLWLFYRKEKETIEKPFDSHNYPRGTWIICSFQGSQNCNAFTNQRTEVLNWSNDDRFFLLPTSNRTTGERHLTWLDADLFYNVSACSRGLPQSTIDAYTSPPRAESPSSTPSRTDPESIPPHLR